MRQTKHVASDVIQKRRDDAQLWAAALTVSVLLHIVLIAWISIETIRSEKARKELVQTPPPPEQTVKIFPEMFEQETPEESAKKPAEEAAKTVRTSPEQEAAEPPASRRYIGERNTRATSDSAPTGDDLDMPSQAGREPLPGEVETTESDYQDGRLDVADNSNAAEPAPPAADASPAEPVEALPEQAKGEETPDPGMEEEAQTAIREKLLDGPNPVDTPVPQAELKEDVKPREEKKVREGIEEGLAEKKPEEMPEVKPEPESPPKPREVDDPAFRGNQSKTVIQGNISRTGVSSLDVSDTAMGRYQAAIGRAVEKEWQKNCVLRRDFIVPGYLTVRFHVMADGRVKSVQFVGDIEGGEVQKGFTLQSIREAPIPPMPPAVKAEMGGDALELLFNFYF